MAEYPKKQDIIDFIEQDPENVKKENIAKAFGLKGTQRMKLKHTLRELKAEGLIGQTNHLPAVCMICVTSCNEDGDLYASPILSGKLQKDLTFYILPNTRHTALAIGDKLLARFIKNTSGETHAKVIKVISKKESDKLLGTIIEKNNKLAFQTIDRRKRKIFNIDDTNHIKIKTNDIVFATPSTYGCVRLMSLIGDLNDPDCFSLISLAEQNIPLNFPEDVLAEAERVVPTSLGKRTDLRHLPFVTIDPETARDHDDALYAHQDNSPDNVNGYIIYVAIADVSVYVKTDSLMDKQARHRGNSVYLPDRVVPMLPENISNNLCSLRPHEDRPCLVARIVINEKGEAIKHQFMRSMIRSHARLSYQQAQYAFLGKQDSETQAVYKDCLQPLWNAYQLMAERRNQRQPLELNLAEYEIVMQNGEITDIYTPERLEAMRLVEEMMISANICAAQTLEKHNMAQIYRVHNMPSEEKVKMLADYVKTCGLRLDLGQTRLPRLFNQLLHNASKTEYKDMMQERVLRCQAQAIYHPENIGHFGLNLTHYTHFTSPIRRFSDLIIHRALIRALKLGDDGLTDEECTNLEQISEHISMTERRAITAERSAKTRYMAAFMDKQKNKNLVGNIAGLNKAGIFIKLKETGAEGFIPMSHLAKERLQLDKNNMSLKGQRSGKTFAIGDKVTVTILETNPIAGGLLFQLIDKNKNKNKKTKISTSSKRSKSRAGRRKQKEHLKSV